MNRNILMKALYGLVLVAGIVTAVTNTAYAGETSNDWDAFMKTIDPSYSSDVNKEPLCQLVSDLNTVSEGKTSSNDWDMFLLSVDPSQSANMNKVMLCTGTAEKKVAQTSGSEWDAFMKLMNPRS